MKEQLQKLKQQHRKDMKLLRELKQQLEQANKEAASAHNRVQELEDRIAGACV